MFVYFLNSIRKYKIIFIHLGAKSLPIWWQISVKEVLGFALIEQFLMGSALLRLRWSISSKTFSIRPPTKWRRSVFVLPGICHQKSTKWLGPFYQRHSKCNLTISFYWIVIALSILLLQFQLVHFGLYCQWTPKTILGWI